MATEKKLALQTRDLLFERGQKGLEYARQIMKKESIPYKPLDEVVDFFMSSWQDVVHPALLSIACEAVGGKSADTLGVAAAFVLLAGGADLHDDIIDESKIKDSKPTVYGKYGKDLTVLAGDLLIFKGLYVLNEVCLNLAAEQKKAVLDSTKQAFFGISSAEAKELSLRKKSDIADEYLEMIRLKSAVSEATTKIGAILGNGTPDQIRLLGEFGKNFGVLFTLRDEFIDVLDFKEFKNRRDNECLPLPIQLVLKEQGFCVEILKLIAKNPVTKKSSEKLYELVIDLKPNVELKKEMFEMVEKTINKIQLSGLNNQHYFKLLLKSMIEDL
jgi:geranylgeranyl pyrophosphate synthase